MSTCLPAQASVVVIGGGVMGCSTLYHLARLGAGDAVLLERHQLASGTTWHSAAQVRALRSSYNLTQLIRYSIELYARLERDTGQSVGWVQNGSVSIAATPDRHTHILRQTALARLFGVRASALSVGEARERWPLMNADDVVGAAWSPDDGRVSPADLCAALAKGARAAGAKVFENTPVTGIVTRGGRVRGVRTAAGEVRCDAVAVCAGLWSRAVAAMAGAAAPLWPCEHFYLLTQPMDGVSRHLPTLSDHDSHLYMRDEGGGLLVGCFEPLGKAIDPARLNAPFELLPEDWAHFEPMMENALARVPALQDAQVKTLLNGPESFTPDGSFLLGETTHTRGLFLGCGMNSVGVATGGGAGHALAHCIAHGFMPAALPEADPARFAECFNSAAALAARAPETLGRHYEIAYPVRQPASARDLRLPPLTALWRERGAKFGQVFGWERPLYFGAAALGCTFARPEWFAVVAEEARRAHAEAALFDLSTLGKIRVRGADAERFLNRVCTADMTRPPGRMMYAAMLNARGGMESDLTAMRLAADDYVLYTGSAAIARDLAHLRRHLQDGERVTLQDETEQYVVLALNGARAAAVAAAAGGGAWRELRRFCHTEATLAGAQVRVARLSYVGEAGWEITVRAEDAVAVAEALLAAGAAPAGLFAQTSMRIEKGHIAYGHDVDSDITPLQAGLPLRWDKEFAGKEALLAWRDGPTATRAPRLRSVLASADAPLIHGGEPVLAGGEYIGQITSAAYGHRLRQQAALALLRVPAGAGDAIAVEAGGELVAARVVDGPAYDAAGARLEFDAV